MISILLIPTLLLIVASAGFFLVGKALSERLLHLLVALGAGVMIAVALLHVFPEAIELSPYAPIAFIV
jgi:zinc transporter ZupT